MHTAHVPLACPTGPLPRRTTLIKLSRHLTTACCRWSESCLEDGEPKLITVWIPLTPTTVSNGTIYVLPKEYDG